MSGALWLLIGLQLRGWLRYLLGRLLTLKGALLAILGGTFFVLWAASVCFAQAATPRSGFEPLYVQRSGPGVLLVYCVLNVLLSPVERGVYFSPAEVNFLFPAPFGRRSLLGYKVVFNVIIGLPSSLVLSAISYGFSTSFLRAFVGMTLIVLFMQLFTMAVNLIAVSAGARLYSRGRKFLLVAVLALAALILWRVAGDPPRWDFRALLRVENTVEWQAVTLPLTWFFKTFTAETLWPDLVKYAALGLLVNGVLLGVVFALDAHYMEASAAASAKIYARIQRVRSGAGGAAPPGKVRFTLPMLPSLGGVGTLCWRQLTTTLRMPGRLFVVVMMFFAVLVVSQAVNLPQEFGTLTAVLAGAIVLGTAIFLTALIPFDFRGDVDRIALLKTLPIPPWRVALGQVLAPVVIVTAVQWLVLLAVYVWGLGGPRRPGTLQPGTVLLLCGLFAVPVNGLLFSLENLLFLLFPTRVLANNPADFQATGRNILLTLAKVTVLGGVFLLAVLMGGLVSLFFPILGCVVAWVTIALFTAPLLPLIGWAFTIYDVSRDTPA
jgi:ABC-2 type transport system permease protein